MADPCSCPRIVGSRSTAENIDIAFLIWEIVKILFAIALFFFSTGKDAMETGRTAGIMLSCVEWKLKSLKR